MNHSKQAGPMRNGRNSISPFFLALKGFLLYCPHLVACLLSKGELLLDPMGSGATKGGQDKDLTFEEELAAMGVRRLKKEEIELDPESEFFRQLEWMEKEHREQFLKLDPSFRIIFEGSPEEAFVKGARVIVSFPGAHGTAWNVLMQRAKLKNSLATTCVFLPDKDAPGFGVHVPDPQRDARGHEKGVPKDACHCYHLYGKEHWPAEWGCKWYDMWMRKTRTASEKGCELCVVTKGDGGLGNSQKGEVRFLEKELGQSFKTLSLVEFASWAACEAMKRGQDGVMIQK